MSLAAKWVTSVAAGVITLGGSFATIGGGLDKADKLVTTEAEHTVDIDEVNRKRELDRLRFEAYKTEEKIDDLVDLRQRAIRERDRLEYQLANEEYSNNAAYNALDRSYNRNKADAEKAQKKIDTLELLLDAIDKKIEEQ